MRILTFEPPPEAKSCSFLSNPFTTASNEALSSRNYTRLRPVSASTKANKQPPHSRHPTTPSKQAANAEYTSVVSEGKGQNYTGSVASDSPVAAAMHREGELGLLSDNETEEHAGHRGEASMTVDMVTSTSTGSLGMYRTVASSSAPQVLASRAGRRRKPRRRVPLHIEVALLPSSTSRTCRTEIIKDAVASFIQDNFDSLLPDSRIVDWDDVPMLWQHVREIRVTECPVEEAIRLDHAQLHIHVYRPSQQYIVDSFSAGEPGEDDAEDGNDGAGEDADIMAATVAQLPSVALEGVWDTLIYEDAVKLRLLNYINSTQIFGDRMVDFNVITWNRVVLLHGPPGTGKTSLCRALAQKLAIRLSDRYTHGKLVEINSHSIMSKWFSESGKLVQRLFSRVLELVEDETCFVVVLIDEVESLTTARAGAMSGKEPSDAVRVVNALLTQLDKLKNRKNVLVLTTSNLSSSIDSAFIDRADIKQYIGLPPVEAIYWILLGCLRELMRSGIIRESALLDWKRLKLHETGLEDASISQRTIGNSRRLKGLAGLCHGMSGRTLRRLPLLAHARHMSEALSDYMPHTWDEDDDDESTDEYSEVDPRSGSATLSQQVASDDVDTIEVWLQAMSDAVLAQKEQQTRVEEGH